MLPRRLTVNANEPEELQQPPWSSDFFHRTGRFSRWLWTALGTAVVVLWSIHRNHVTEEAWGLPDVRFYLDMARGRYDLVPQPFTSRPLAPLLAGLFAHVAHGTVGGGFTILAILSVACTSAVVCWLLLRSTLSRWMLPALLCLPFWPQLLSYTGLPDPLYTALLALLLLALKYDRLYLAALLLLPLMLARESTSLTLVCLLLSGWRQLRWGGCALAVACAAAGALVVQHFSALGLANPEHLSGGLYMVGKVVSNTMRTLGVVPWSNVYPVLCPVPAWKMPLSLGSVRSVGVCSWNPQGALQASWAFLTTFGALPLLLLVLLKRRVRNQLGRASLAVRFATLYGATSLLLAPTLGTWYARLFAYAWPLLLVAVPRLYGMLLEDRSRTTQARAGGLWYVAISVLHVTICAAGIQVETLRLLVLVCGLQLLGVGLLWVQLRRPDPSLKQA